MPHVRCLRSVAFVLLVVLFTPTPSFAQVSLSGDWTSPFFEDQLERAAGPELGDYGGLPVNDAARMFADTWDASTLSLQEHQCRPHSAPYTMRGPLNMRVWEEKEPATQKVIAIKMFVATFGQLRTIYMDGRPHPSSNALHTWQGFSTGRWVGPMLTVTTTHIKPYFIRRNGIPQSDRVELTEHFIRHGTYMTHISYTRDPIYLAEPLIKTETYILNLNAQEATYQTHLSCQPDEEIAGRPRGYVPHHLPGTNKAIHEYATKYRIPFEATRGGPETMYPEFRASGGATLSSAGPLRGTRPTYAVPDRGPGERPGSASGSRDLDVLRVRDDVYLIAGAGGNSVLQFGPQGALIVDTGGAQMSEKILAAVRRVTNEPIRYIINTSVDPDHIGGNEPIGKTGAAIPARELRDQNAVTIAHENVLNRMSAPTGEQAPTPSAAWPTASYFVPRKDLFFNDQGIEIRHMAAAHTDGDSIVFFRRSDVICTGDVFNMNTYPVIDVEKGGTINGTIEALNTLLDLAIAGEKEEGGTVLVPGHGRLADEADLVDYRDMVTIIRDRVADMRNKGMTRDQVRAARPTMDFDGRFGATTGPWTTEMFLTAVYNTITK